LSVFPAGGGRVNIFASTTMNFTQKGGPMPNTACTSGLACGLLSLVGEWKDLFPLMGAVIVAVTGAVMAFVVTGRLNRAMKQTEFFLRFTERFHKILLAKHQLEMKVEQALGTATLQPQLLEKEVRELYRQLFGLMFDEFFAYQRGFLDHEAFVEWMRWRHIDHTGTNFAIAGLSYPDGWARYCDQRPHEGFKDFLNLVHAATHENEIAPLVLRHAPRSQRLGAWIANKVREWKIVLVFFAALLLALGLLRWMGW
jgi:hypothetical protein